MVRRGASPSSPSQRRFLRLGRFHRGWWGRGKMCARKRKVKRKIWIFIFETCVLIVLKWLKTVRWWWKLKNKLKRPDLWLWICGCGTRVFDGLKRHRLLWWFQHELHLEGQELRKLGELTPADCWQYSYVPIQGLCVVQLTAKGICDKGPGGTLKSHAWGTRTAWDWWRKTWWLYHKLNRRRSTTRFIMNWFLMVSMWCWWRW